jgi:hypothetical protein
MCMVSPQLSQAIEIVGARNGRVRGFVRFQGFMTHFISRFFRHPFSDPPVGPSLNLCFQNLSIARILFRGKPKDESLSLDIRAVQ